MRKLKNKYGNKKVEYNGVLFDSKRERDRYVILKQAQDNGEIYGLKAHPKWELIPKITEEYVKHLKTKDVACSRTVQLAITYTADFSYNKPDGSFVVEDVKISPKILPAEFRLKIKMMRAIHGISVRCVYKPTEAI